MAIHVKSPAALDARAGLGKSICDEAFDNRDISESLVPAQQVQPFVFDKYDVRVINRDGEPWFVASDACDALGIGNPRQAVTRLDDDEKDAVILNDAIGRPQETTIVNESGLYALVFSSGKAAAKRFKKWVRSEVLPSIRKTGAYGTPGAIDYSTPAAQLGVFQALLAKAEAAEALNAVLAPKAAAQDRLAMSEGEFVLTAASKILDMDYPEFRARLKERGHIFKRGKSRWLPSEPMRRKKSLRLVTETLDDPHDTSSTPRQITNQFTVVTPAGMDFFAKRLNREGQLRAYRQGKLL
jgi:anti-repressor protein